MSQITGAIGTALGGYFGAQSQQADKERAEQYAQQARNELDYHTQVQGQGNTEFGKIDPTSRDAMMQALASYDSRVNAGGLDATGRATLEGAKAESAQQAAQAARQIQAEAAARGGGNVGAKAQLLQTIAGQQAGEASRQGAFQSAALAEQARNAALQGKMGAAGAIYGMDASKAAAQDAINQFNVRNAQQNVANDAQRAGMRVGADTNQLRMFEGRAGQDVKNFAGLGKMAGGAIGVGLGAGQGAGLFGGGEDEGPNSTPPKD